MDIESKLTRRKYNPEDVIYIGNWQQFIAYMANGADEHLVDVYYDGTKERNKMVFVFEKTDRTRELYRLWNLHLLEF